MPRYDNQKLINIMQIKSEPIASDSPWLMFKLIEDQGCKHNDKKFRLFVRKLSFSWSKNGFFIFCNSEVINVWICCVESIPPSGPFIKKFFLVRIGLTLNSKKCGVYNLVLPSRVDSACTSFFGRTGSVASQQFSFAIILTWCQFWMVFIIEMKKCNEIVAKIFGVYPKIDGKMQCNFSENAER